MLTDMFDAVSERGHRTTPAGMAHWSGSGPAGKTCRDCALFKANKSGPQGKCTKFAALMRATRRRWHWSEFPGSVSACKAFSPTD